MSNKIGVSKSAFKDDTSILTAEFKKQCSYIDNYAFEGCTSLNEINENNVIEKIGLNAFVGTDLISVHFCYLTDIQENAFNSCSNLKYINIPKCKSIGNSAFKNCLNLTTININEKININDEAFYGCTSLKNINFNDVIKIGNSAFSDCKSITSLKLNNCENIGKGAFINCENLKQLSLSKCKLIGDSAFVNCPNLNKVYIYNISDENTSEDNFCYLESVETFCTNNNSECQINSNITFYINEKEIDNYINDDNWKHYLKYMKPIPNNDQVLYITEKSTIAKITVDAEKLLLSNNGNIYNNVLNYGVLNFQRPVLNFIKNIFENKGEITFIYTICINILENAFEDFVNLEDIEFSDNLIHISDYAFKNCKSLTSFTIPETVKSLGEGIFAGCENIKQFEGNFVTYNNKAIVYENVLICFIDDNIISEKEWSIINISDIANNISTLGMSCFHGCKNVRRINIPPTITKINNKAFEQCTNLLEIHFEGNTPPILGENIFAGIDVTKIKIFVPEESLEYYYETFKNYICEIYPKPNNNSIIYYTIDDITLDESHTTKINNNGNYHIISNVNSTVSTNLFKGKNNVTKVILGEDIIKISEDAFKDCTELTYIYLPDTISELNNKCFYGCSNIESIHIPNGNKEQTIFGDEIFCGCSKLKEFRTYYKNKVSVDNRCYIQDSILMFFAQGNLSDNEKNYIIPDNITTINKSAFKGSDITSITLKKSTTTIGDSAFYDCEELTTINEWDNITEIGDSAFKNCYKFKYVNHDKDQINLNLNISEIKSNTFCNCTELIKISINNNIETIGESAFEGCKKLQEVLISEFSTLTEINNKAFYNCEKLTNLYLPNSLSTIGESAFEGCTSYKGSKDKDDDDAITIYENISLLGNACFKNTGISKLNMESKELSKIPDSAFENCKELKIIKINDKNNIDTIGYNAFRGCEKLDNIFTPNNSGLYNLQIIEDYAFYGCKNISIIYLPLMLKKLGDECLLTYTELKIYIPYSLEPPQFTIGGKNSTDSKPFGSNDRENLMIYVPYNKKTMYSNNLYWRRYKMMSYGNDNPFDVPTK